MDPSDYPYTPEQDEQPGAGDDLPTYEDLAAQKGPNSRFGRWQGWIEKRAAERFVGITPEERRRRRERGWGNDMDARYNGDQGAAEQSQSPEDINSPWSPSNGGPVPGGLPPSYSPQPPEVSSSSSTSSSPTIPHIGEPLPRTHLKIHNFGSRFLPHSTTPIRTLLPILNDSLLLVGHDEGLSVMNMFPSGDPNTSSPADAVVKQIWCGEGVYQLELLESEEVGSSTPQGIVLALVGSEVDNGSKDTEPMRSLRMYNLASLTSLARWAVMQKEARPLDLRRPSNWSPQQTSPRRHKAHASITKGLRNLIIDPQNSNSSGDPSEPPLAFRSVAQYRQTRDDSFIPSRENTASSVGSAWDMVDDLPLRWATDYVSLATTGSRLLNVSVLFFQLRKDDTQSRQGRALLAVATKSCVLLYETPKGERAFKFVKEFYAPLTPRAISFVEQLHHEQRHPRSFSGGAFSPTDSIRAPLLGTPLQPSQSRASSMVYETSSHLSVFVVFEKKAGLIRIADSAVGEVELHSTPEGDYREFGSLSGLSPGNSMSRRSRSSFDGFNMPSKEVKGPWLPPLGAELPIPLPPDNGSSEAGYSYTPRTQQVYFLTRGRVTHIVQAPLVTPMSSSPPLKAITWLSQPRDICIRICYPPLPSAPPFLQIVGLGELGVEVQEMALSFLIKDRDRDKGKGKGPLSPTDRDEPSPLVMRAQADIGGDVGFLCHGGMWHRQWTAAPLARSDSLMSYDSFSSDQLIARRSTERGIYVWCQKDAQDWRVVWLGGVELNKDLDSYGDSFGAP